MKLRSKLFYGYVLSLVIYSAILLIPDPLPAVLKQYNVSASELRLINLTIIALLAAIWFAGFYGYAKLQAYSQMIKDSKDGKAVQNLAKGLFLLAVWLPVSSIISSALNYYAMRHPDFLKESTIINHYIGLLLPLAGFIFIGLGARGLSYLSRSRPSYGATTILSLVLIYVSIIYIRLVATTEQRDLVYQLSMWPILTTLVAPYLFMWSVGAVAAYELFLYSRKIAGSVYRKSWRLLALGFGWLIVTSMSFQYVTTLSARLQKLSIYWILVIVYALLLILSIGFVLISLGTRKLQKIEEV